MRLPIPALLVLAGAAFAEDVAEFSRRGDARLFAGEFREAVGEFEKMIALDAKEDAPHWRLGIAYYLAGDFAKAARQFEKYQQHESGDRENGIWHFMSNARANGIEAARREMIAFERFDREPFPALYEMFAGRITTDAFLADVKARGLAGNEGVMFFANYYAGLYEGLVGHRERALGLLNAAVELGGRAGYMGRVARVQRDVAARR